MSEKPVTRRQRVNWGNARRVAEVVGIGGTLLTALLSLGLNWRNQERAEVQAHELQRIQERQVEAARSLEQLKHNNEYNLHVYEEVVEALKLQDEQMENVATALVLSMPPGSELRQGLLKAIGRGAHSPEAQEAASFAVEEPIPESTPVAGPARWNVDVFYCSSEPDGRKRAETLVGELLKRPLAGPSSVGRIRARLIPHSVNQRAAYRVSGLQIRHEAEEQAAADTLRQAVQPALQSFYGGNTQVDTMLINNPTPGYLSLFLCAAEQAGADSVAGR